MTWRTPSLSRGRPNLSTGNGSAAEADLKANAANTAELVAHSPAAGLTKEPAIGPFTAATALVAWGYPGDGVCVNPHKRVRMRDNSHSGRCTFPT